MLKSVVLTKSVTRDCVNASNELNLLFCAVCSTTTDCVYVANSTSLTKFVSNEELKFSKSVIRVSKDAESV